MVKKIISGGQTGADRAALDFAIKHKIPHGGWSRKQDCRGRRSFQEIPAHRDAHHQLPEKNRDERNWFRRHHHILAWPSNRGSAYTKTMATKHAKPYLHIDLDKDDIFQAALLMLEWIDLNEIKTLNVAGPRASKDPGSMKK